MLALLSFADCSVQMLDGFVAMSMELALGVRQMLPGAPHHFDRLVDARVRGKRWGRHSNRGLAGAAATGTGAAGVFGPVAAAGKAKSNRSIAVIKSVNNPIFFMRFLLVRIPARTPPLKSMATETFRAGDPRHPPSISAPRRTSLCIS